MRIRASRWRWRGPPIAVGLAALVSSCSNDPEVACGQGTRLMGAVCVPISLVGCGEGTHEVNGACVPDSMIACGTGTHEEGGACVPDSVTECGEGTMEQNGICVPIPIIEPSDYESPVVLLQRLAGQNDHMHLDEVRYVDANQWLYVCSYDFAVVNVANPGNLRYIVQGLKVRWPDGQGFRTRYPMTGTRTGGCINLAVDGEYVYTTHRGNIDDPTYLGGWRLAPAGNGVTPTQLPLLAEANTSYEGVDYANGLLYVGLGVDGFAIYEHDRTTTSTLASDVFVRRGSLGGLNHVLGLRVVGNIAYAADGLGGLVTIDVSDPDAPSLMGFVSTVSQARDVRVDVRADRTTVYVAAAGAGLVVVDATDPANMSVIGMHGMPGSAQRLDHAGDRVVVAAWNDARAYDVSDPTMPKFIGAARMTRQLPGTTAADQDGRPEVTSRTLGIAINSADPDIMFAGNWHVPYSYRIHADREAPFIYLPEEVNLIDFGPTAVGETATKQLVVSNEGNAPLNLVHMYTSNDAFTVSPPQVSIPAASSAMITLTYQASIAEKENAILYLRSDDPAQPQRKAYLVGNQGGLGVGVALPETTVALVDGGEWSSTSPENTGKVQMLAYFATF